MNMGKYKLIAVYLIFMFFFGCKAKQVEKIETKERTELQMPMDNALTIETLCDSIGNPVQLDKVITSKSGLTMLKIKDNTLEFRTVNDTIVVYKEKLVNKEVKEVRFKWAKITWFFLFGLILFTAFWKIPRAINTIIVKIVRGFFGIPF